jgi:formyltetrahydrofolate-dependent phosphoribosylglycinamide formyltransferase
MPKRIAVLASGDGTNLQALVDYLSWLGAARSGDVVLVASDNAGAGALGRAARHGIRAAVLDRAARGPALLPLLVAERIDLVVLAGYLRLVPPEVTAAFRGRVVNLHPALLPAFGGRGMYGERVHAAVLSSGVRLTGVTVHFVDEQYDHGPIIAQWPVPVVAGDSAATLADRVHAVEHRLYPRVIQSLAAGGIVLERDGRVAGPRVPFDPGQFALSADLGEVERGMESVLRGEG